MQRVRAEAPGGKAHASVLLAHQADFGAPPVHPEQKQGSAMGDEFGESLALLPRRSEPWIWISKPSERSVNEFIGRRSAPTGALSVKRPGKYELRRTIVSSSHSLEPMVDERGFPDPGPGND